MPQIDDLLADAPPAIQYDAEKPRIIRYHEALREAYNFRYNVITDIMEFKPVDDTAWLPLEEADLNSIWLDFQLNTEFGSKDKPGDSIIKKLIYSRFTEHYNEFEIYLKNLRYDGKQHIEQLAATLKIADVKLAHDSSLSTALYPLFRRWMIAAVACALGQAPNQVMLLLIGPQGTYKTTWLNRLCPVELSEYRFTGHIMPDLADKQTANLLAEKIILNIDDQLETIFGKDFNKIKSIISIDQISNRKAYRRDDKNRRRRANIVGSVNSDKIFLDNENRRYLTFKVTGIDIKAEVNIGQCWAEAYELYRKGERSWFNSEEVKMMNEINNRFAVNTPEEEYLQRCYEVVTEEHTECRFVMFNEIISALRQVSGLNLRDGNLRNAMKKCGWPEPTSKRIPGAVYPVYCYCIHENFMRDQMGRAYLAGQVIHNNKQPDIF